MLEIENRRRRRAPPVGESTEGHRASVEASGSIHERREMRSPNSPARIRIPPPSGSPSIRLDRLIGADDLEARRGPTATRRSPHRQADPFGDRRVGNGQQPRVTDLGTWAATTSAASTTTSRLRDRGADRVHRAIPRGYGREKTRSRKRPDRAVQIDPGGLGDGVQHGGPGSFRRQVATAQLRPDPRKRHRQRSAGQTRGPSSVGSAMAWRRAHRPGQSSKSASNAVTATNWTAARYAIELVEGFQWHRAPARITPLRRVAATPGARREATAARGRSSPPPSSISQVCPTCSRTPGRTCRHSCRHRARVHRQRARQPPWPWRRGGRPRPSP